MTAKEAAAYLRVSVWTVRRYVDQGLLPEVRIGSGTHRFRRADLDALIERSVRLRPSGAAPRAVKPIEPQKRNAVPAWLDSGRMNPLTGRPFGSRG